MVKLKLGLVEKGCMRLRGYTDFICSRTPQKILHENDIDYSLFKKTHSFEEVLSKINDLGQIVLIHEA